MVFGKIHALLFLFNIFSLAMLHSWLGCWSLATTLSRSSFSPQLRQFRRVASLTQLLGQGQIEGGEGGCGAVDPHGNCILLPCSGFIWHFYLIFAVDQAQGGREAYYLDLGSSDWILEIKIYRLKYTCVWYRLMKNSCGQTIIVIKQLELIILFCYLLQEWSSQLMCGPIQCISAEMPILFCH